MNILRKSTFLFLISLLLISGFFFTINIEQAYAIPDDGNSAQSAAADEERQRQKDEETVMSQPVKRPPTRGSLESSKTQAKTTQTNNSRGGLESSKKDDDNDHQRRTSVRGGKSFNGTDLTPQSTSVAENGTRASNQSETRAQPRATGGFFNRIFGAGGFFSRLFGGGNRTTTNEPRVFPTSNRDRSDSNSGSTPTKPQGPVDLVPETTKVTVGESNTIFMGQIVLSSANSDSKWRVVGKCSDGNQEYTEGTSRQTLTNDDGTFRTIADASFVCRSGEWKTEGGLPVDSNPQGEANARGDTQNGAAAITAVGKVLGARKSADTGGTGPVSRTPSEKTKYIISDSDRSNEPSKRGDSQSPIITSKLLVDYSCDGSIEIEKEFTSPNTSIASGNNRVIPLSVRTETGAQGNHCFAFDVDTLNSVEETNEGNNKTAWHNFEVTSNAIPLDPSLLCPAYNPPLCAQNEELVPGTTGVNGCATAPQCIASGVTMTDNLNLKVKSYNQSNTGGVSVYTADQDWTSDDITVSATDKLHFSWEAHAYSKCLTYLHPVQYDFGTQNVGNTESSNQEIRTLNGTYAIECTTGDTTYRQEINVIIQ